MQEDPVVIVAAVRTVAFAVENDLDRLGFTDPPQAPAATSPVEGRRRPA